MEYQATSELMQMKKCIEDVCYGGVKLQFENSLHDWGRQGVLCLNTALTCSNEKEDAHVNHWELFLKEVLTSLSDKDSGLIFAFIGDACKYTKYVDDSKHFVLQEKESIRDCVITKKIWRSNIFNDIDEVIVTDSGDPFTPIEW